MTETATPTQNHANPIMDRAIYWKLSAYALLIVALLGIVMNIATADGTLMAGFLVFDWAHNITHLVLAAIAFGMVYSKMAPAMARNITIVFGVVYAALGIAGFMMADIGPIHLEMGENLLHLLLGAWALMAGVGGR